MAEAAPLQIAVDELAHLRAGPQAPAILDVREGWEVEICAFPDALHIPLGELPGRLDAVPADRQVVVVCHHGMRSLQAVQWLRAQGRDRTTNLVGGIDAWARLIDPAMAQY